MTSQRLSAWEATLAFAAVLQQFSLWVTFYDGFLSGTSYWDTTLGNPSKILSTRRRRRRTDFSTNILLLYHCFLAVIITPYTWNINKYNK